MRRQSGDAVQETYALGGGKSGAEPDVAGILTFSAMALLADDVPDEAIPSARAAPSAVTHGIPVTHVPCEGFEHGACSEVASSLDVPVFDKVPSIIDEDVISAMDAACDPLIAAMPGVVHTAPLITMVW